MKNLLFKNVERLLRSPSRANTFLLSKIFKKAIPFNDQHDFEIIEVTQDSVSTQCDYKRKNMNHLKGIHACAIATIGEYSAGLIISKKLGLADYRMIMKDIKVEYIKQARENVISTATLRDAQIMDLKNELESKDKVEVVIESVIKNESSEVSAKCQTSWQLKTWETVSFK